MTITIPEWLLWGLGGVAGLIILGLAAIGVALLWAMPTRFF